MLAPLMDVEGAAHQQVAPDRGHGIHGAIGACAKPVTTLPVLVLISAMFFTLVPLTLVKFPPM